MARSLVETRSRSLDLARPDGQLELVRTSPRILNDFQTYSRISVRIMLPGVLIEHFPFGCLIVLANPCKCTTTCEFNSGCSCTFLHVQSTGKNTANVTVQAVDFATSSSEAVNVNMELS